MAHSPLATPSATLAVLAAHGLATKKRLGQHFLVDDNVVGRILDLAAIGPGDSIVEVGPGIGTLTVALCAHAGAVVAVERDPDLLPVLRETTAGCPHLIVVEADAVDVEPAKLVTAAGPPTALVANLPYSVAATVVLRFFQELPSLRSATVMVQAEVADRMTASPGGKDYGAYTVKLRLIAEPSGRFSVGAGCFLPPPRVASAVVRFDRVPGAQEHEVADAAAAAVAAFGQRRKTMRNSLAAGLGVPAPSVESVLVAAGYDPRARAESLSVERYVELGRILRKSGLLG